MQYAIAIGRQRTIVDSWLECKSLTEGYPNAKFKKVDSFEEGEEYIKQIIGESVLQSGYEFRVVSRRSKLPYSNGMTNVYLTIRSEKIKSRNITNSSGYRVMAIITTSHDIPLPELEYEKSYNDTRRKYIVNVDYDSIGVTRPLSIVVILTAILNELRKHIADISLVINTDSNYLIEVLSNKIISDVRILADMKIMYSEELQSLYSSIEYVEGLYLNYEVGSHVSNDGTILNDLIREEAGNY